MYFYSPKYDFADMKIRLQIISVFLKGVWRNIEKRANIPVNILYISDIMDELLHCGAIYHKKTVA